MLLPMTLPTAMPGCPCTAAIRDTASSGAEVPKATIVAFGTSAPELAVSLMAAVQGHPGIAVGNVIGSNIANVFMVLGVPALVYTISTQDKGARSQSLFMVGVTVLFIFMCFNSPLNAFDGMILLGFLAIAVVASIKGGMAVVDLGPQEQKLERVLGLPSSPWFMILFVVLGGIAMPVGADLTLRGAASIAIDLGVPEAVIAVSVVALGTSLPELSTTLIAAFHRQMEMAVGNVIGSNVLNLLLVMAVTSLVVDVPVVPEFLRLDLWVMLAAAVVLAALVTLRIAITRTLGALFVIAYVSFVWSAY